MTAGATLDLTPDPQPISLVAQVRDGNQKREFEFPEAVPFGPITHD
jgi:hypothetical protein